VDPSEHSTRELELRLRQAALTRPGSALRLRQRPDSAWQAAFTEDPGHPAANGTDLPTWISKDAPSKRDALLRLWRFVDSQRQFDELRRNRDR
jgi:hypothetical protein